MMWPFNKNVTCNKCGHVVERKSAQRIDNRAGHWTEWYCRQHQVPWTYTPQGLRVRQFYSGDGTLGLYDMIPVYDPATGHYTGEYKRRPSDVLKAIRQEELDYYFEERAKAEGWKKPVVKKAPRD